MEKFKIFNLNSWYIGPIGDVTVTSHVQKTKQRLNFLYSSFVHSPMDGKPSSNQHYMVPAVDFTES